MPDQKKYINGDNLVKYDEIIKDWVDDKVVELTQAEYDALSEAEKMNGTVYYITDGESGSGGASVQADWNEADPTEPAYIQNKPTLGTAAGKNVVIILDSSTNLPTASAVSTALATKANGAGLTFSVVNGILTVTTDD